MTTPMNVLTMIDHAQANGGGTYKVSRSQYSRVHFQPLDFSTGYYVSLPNGVEHLPILPAELIFYVAEQCEAEDENAHLGLWRDDNGLWSLDRTLWFYSRDSALALGRLWDQRTIWDIANGVAIPVGT
jgi:hypothetical protein